VVYLGLQNEREWVRFCEQVLNRPELVHDPRFSTNSCRVEHHEVLEGVITEAFAHSTAAAVVQRLDAADIANARMNTVREFLDHPQLQARGKWGEIESPAGRLRALKPPFMLDDVECPMGAVPALGEHTDAVLRELGFDDATIASWRAAGII
jgi:crotonobetainyl-CoA:carnitine CoA-transferase CaiB-like acyl-CoA transferase